MNRKQFLLTLFSPILAALGYKDQFVSDIYIKPARSIKYIQLNYIDAGFFYCPYKPLD